MNRDRRSVLGIVIVFLCTTACDQNKGVELDAMQMDGSEMQHMEAVILSMTPSEREDPSVIEASRRRRIAKGSGQETQDVSGLIKSFTQAAGVMKQMAGMGTRDRMKMAQSMGQMGMAGGFPGKVKKRSKRLTAKQRANRKKKKRKK